MDYTEYIQIKERFTFKVLGTMQEMGLKVLEKGVDFFSFKPDLVAVYPDKMKYYIIEPVSEGCIAEHSPRLYTRDSFEEFRLYCKKLFSDDETKAAIAASVICDLAAGVEAFQFKAIGSLELNSMAKYGCLAVPIGYENDTAYVLNYLKIAFQNLNILDRFTLILISRKQSELLGETKKFIRFILENR